MANRTQLKFELGYSGWLAPGKTLIIRGVFWAAILYAIIYALLVISVFGAQWLGMPVYADYLLGIGLPIFGFVFYGILVRVGEHRSPSEIAFTPSSVRDMVVGFVIGAAILVTMLLLLDGLGLYSIHIGQWRGWFDSLVFDSYISGMLEELAFRAVLLRIFARLINPTAGLLISSAFFGLAHLTHATAFQALEIAFNAGLTMGLPYMLTGRIWMSVGMHIGWDFTEESLLGINTRHGLFLSVPNPMKPVLLTGGAYGPDGSLFAAVVGALFVAAMLYAHKLGWLGRNRAALIHA